MNSFTTGLLSWRFFFPQFANPTIEPDKYDNHGSKNLVFCSNAEILNDDIIGCFACARQLLVIIEVFVLLTTNDQVTGVIGRFCYRVLAAGVKGLVIVGRHRRRLSGFFYYY